MPIFDFQDHPGLLYVIATLLPLASFLLLILAGALRTALQPAPGSGSGGPLYHLLGGAAPVRAGAYIATGAIGGAFILSLIGFVLFTRDHDQAHHESNAGAHNEAHAKAHDEHDANAAATIDPARAKQEQFENRWKDRLTWASMAPKGTSDMASGSLLQLGYRIDHLGAVMFLMVTFIATLIHVFSIGYMRDELQPIVEDHQVHTPQGHLQRRGRFGRFFLFMSLFCFSMLNLVLADNLFQVFLSWELVGICSYLLIGFYHERRSASNAANKAFITNRIGDAGFILGLLIIWTYIGTFNFEDIFKRIRSPLQDSHGDMIALGGQIVRANQIKPGATRYEVAPPREGDTVVLFPVPMPAHYHGLEAGSFVDVSPQFHAENPETPKFGQMAYWLLVAAGMGIFLGCVGKSAQFPLHVWLPDAMEGPTPVSALIHAATMVAAGVYLVGRCFPIFTPESRLVIAYTGGITLFVAATIALVMTDIKKVLAYSTVSQLGYMMLALGVGGWVAGLFHLVTHAFFKALLFLCSGSVIFGCHHEQDMLKMGGLFPKMKITAVTMLIGVLTIAGIPLFSGWYSKDAILANALGFVMVHKEHGLLFLLPLFTAGITTFYMFRMWFLTFAGKPRDHHVYEHAHESPHVMTVPLMILAFFSVVVAWGWPIYDAEASALEGHIHHAEHAALRADFDNVSILPHQAAVAEAEPALMTVHGYAKQYHHLAGNLALGIVCLAIVFASLAYWPRFQRLDPAEAREQFPGVHRFLWNKWYFDELYSVILVRPALAVAGWCRFFDTRVIDGFVDFLGRSTVRLSSWNGQFDLGVVDGLVNLTARVAYATGGWLRTIQTGYLRSYVLFLVLAAVGIFAVLSFFVAVVAAG
jgi:NADH-quinone oxidoreductase subunit L